MNEPYEAYRKRRANLPKVRPAKTLETSWLEEVTEHRGLRKESVKESFSMPVEWVVLIDRVISFFVVRLGKEVVVE